MEGKLKNNLFTLLKNRELELGREISKSELAREVDASPSVIRRWLDNDVTRFDAKLIEGFCRFLECDISDLLYLEPVNSN